MPDLDGALPVHPVGSNVDADAQQAGSAPLNPLPESFRLFRPPIWGRFWASLIVQRFQQVAGGAGPVPFPFK